jgi:UDP-N-acetylmuramyl tripeptide synthase
MWLSRAAGRGGGTALPGLVAQTLDPDVSDRLSRGLTGGSILITGTNGKTTTAGLVRAILRDAGIEHIGNQSGSNLSRGIASCLVEAAGCDGHIQAEIGVLEVDEAALPTVSKGISTRAIAVLNLFRDQLDRHGEIDALALIIGSSLSGPQSIYLNADDPLIASMSQYASETARVRYFGVDLVDSCRPVGAQPADSNRCPLCHAPLEYSRTTFSHLGDYRCPSGDFRRPEADVTVTVLHLDLETMTIRLDSANESFEAVLPLSGIHNAYNAAAAATIALDLGVSLGEVASSLEKVVPSFGRGENLTVDGKEIRLLLAKNPASFTQVIHTIGSARDSPWLFLINDNSADGRDVSWLWDVGFEELQGKTAKVITGGTRRLDLSVRLKYAGLDSEPVRSLRGALGALLESIPEGGTGYVVATYTAMLQLRKLIGRRTRTKDFWR